MLENRSSDLTATVKRYTPPNQRNRSHGRRKSGGDRLEQANSYGSEGERLSVDSFNGSRSKLIAIHGCSNSEASQLMNNRWTAAMNAYNNLPENSKDRPVMYVRKSASAWSQPMLPHLMTQSAAAASTRSERDFMSELRQAMRNANA